MDKIYAPTQIVIVNVWVILMNFQSESIGDLLIILHKYIGCLTELGSNVDRWRWTTEDAFDLNGVNILLLSPFDRVLVIPLRVITFCRNELSSSMPYVGSAPKFT